VHLQRVCFTLQIRPERLAEYRERHAAVWPELLDALTAAGWGNYSLFFDLPGDRSSAVPDAAMLPLPEVFHLSGPRGAHSET
jgi:hypothetical protein